MPVSVPSGYFEKQYFEKKACCLTVCCFLQSRYITLSLYSCKQASIRNSIFLLCHAKSYPDTVKYRMVCVYHDTHRIHTTYLESFLVFKKSHKQKKFVVWM